MNQEQEIADLRELIARLESQQDVMQKYITDMDKAYSEKIDRMTAISIQVKQKVDDLEEEVKELKARFRGVSFIQ